MKRGLCFCLLIAVLLTTVMPVFAADEGAKIEIQTPAELPKAGDEFEIVARMSTDLEVWGFEMDMFVDDEVLECKDIVLGEEYDTEFSVTNPMTFDGAARFGGLFVEKFSGDGVLATYKFLAKKDVSAFDLKVKDVLAIDYDCNELPCTVAGATVILSEEPSDVEEPSDAEEPSDWEEPSETEEPTDEEEPSDAEVPSDAEEKEEEPKEEEAPVTEHLYADTEGHWSESYINAATEKGLFKGDDKGYFNPDKNVTRAQFVTVLWRMAGSPSVEKTDVAFADIGGQSEEFRKAIEWGFANGYINGTSATTFNPDGELTREAAVKILHAYSGGQSGTEMMLASVYNGYFKDSNLISDWARPSVYWGIYYKMISGTSADTISPQGTATRAQLAKILVNYINTYIK